MRLKELKNGSYIVDRTFFQATVIVMEIVKRDVDLVKYISAVTDDNGDTRLVLGSECITQLVAIALHTLADDPE